MPLLRAMLILSGVSAVVSCASLEPLDVADTYVLRSIGGDALPAIFTQNEFATTWTLSDTLLLAADGTGWERTRVRVVVPTDDPPEQTFGYESMLTFATPGNRLEITYDCPDLASCIAGPHLVGRRSSVGLEFVVSLGRTPLLFERVAN